VIHLNIIKIYVDTLSTPLNLMAIPHFSSANDANV